MIINAEKLENVRFIDNDAENKHVIIIEFGSALNSYANYSTEKRAFRVLDMLNKWLTMQRTFSSFRMPQDSEELDA